MPIHHAIDRFKLLEEVRRLEEAGMIIRFILPELIHHKPGELFGVVAQYLIIFDEP
jgi:hypothetical protein